MEIKRDKYYFLTTNEGVFVKVTGMLHSNDHEQYIKDYELIKKHVVVHKKIRVDCSEIKVVLASLCDDLNKLMKTYAKDFSSVEVVCKKDNIFLHNQLERNARKEHFEYKLIEV